MVLLDWVLHVSSFLTPIDSLVSSPLSVSSLSHVPTFFNITLGEVCVDRVTSVLKLGLSEVPGGPQQPVGPESLSSHPCHMATWKTLAWQPDNSPLPSSVWASPGRHSLALWSLGICQNARIDGQAPVGSNCAVFGKALGETLTLCTFLSHN